LWFSDVEIAADFSCKIVADVVVTRHGTAAIVRWISPPRMFRAFTQKLAALIFEVAKKIMPLHA
jgi:hypothetical protein